MKRTNEQEYNLFLHESFFNIFFLRPDQNAKEINYRKFYKIDFFFYFIFRSKSKFKNMDSNCIFLYLSNYHFGEFVLSIFFFSRD